MTTVTLKSAENYLKLILETKKDQALLLLTHPTPQQAEALAEIANNLLDLQEEVPSNVKRVVHKKKGLLKKLSKVKSSVRSRMSFMKKHARTILNILMLIKDTILLLLA